MIPSRPGPELETQRLIDLIEDFNSDGNAVSTAYEYAVQCDLPHDEASHVISHLSQEGVDESWTEPSQVHAELGQ
jgi:hypothetical protein